MSEGTLSEINDEPPRSTSTGTPSGETLSSIAAAGPGSPLPSADGPALPLVLGPFELLQPIGRGSFGTVYRARDTRLERIVAVKVPRRTWLATEDDEQRFLREARSAARLQHPGIVPVYEVGRGDGFPYLVTEFIDGETLATAVQRGRFSPDETAALVALLADALDHAHRQGIVHRDVKPANIMLQAVERPNRDSGRPANDHQRSTVSTAVSPGGLTRAEAALRQRPRLMDFGLARRDDGEASVTQEGEILGTPAYMSPEQARGDSRHVDGRSDIYSLGVVLYRMLAGDTPFRGSGRMLLAQVQFDDPPAPRTLSDQVPRDLETICLKAMAKEPGRRYATAADFAADLRRFLRREPIQARPVGRGERFWRWCRRNPALATLGAAVLLLLVSIAAASMIAAVSLARARDQELARRQAEFDSERQKLRAAAAEQLAGAERARADSEAATARQFSNLLTAALRSADPLGLEGLGFRDETVPRQNVSLDDLLDRIAARVDEEFPQPTLTQAALLDTLGDVYRSIGRYTEAAPLLERSLETRRRMLPDDHPDVATSLLHVGWLLHNQGNHDAAENNYEQALSIRGQVYGDDSLEAAEARFALGWLHGDRQHRSTAEGLFRAVYEVRKEKLGPRHRLTALAQAGLAATLIAQGKDSEAVMHSLATFDSGELLRGFTSYVRAVQARRERRFGESEKGYRAVLDVARRNLPGNHPIVGLLLGDMAGMYRDQGDLVRAEALIREALAIGREVMPRHPRMIEGLFELGKALQRRGELQEAEQLLAEALEIAEHHFGPSHTQTRSLLERLVQVCEAAGKRETAAEYRRRLD